MNKQKPTLTHDQESQIIQLIRRGDRVSQIARIVGVRRDVVESVLERAVNWEMGW